MCLSLVVCMVPSNMWDRMWGKSGQRHPSNKLTALAVNKLKKAGRYADSNGLYLVIDPSGARRWMQRLMIGGKRRDIGLVVFDRLT